MTKSSRSYEDRREQLKKYFDSTAVKAWERLTTDAPVSGIRQTVREGRDRMRSLLLSWLPDDLDGKRLLDAGCGTGALSVEAARRGAQVVGIDISPTLIDIANKRTPEELKALITFQAGDMLAAEAKSFDYVVAMDSIIHYEAADMANAIAELQSRTIDSKSRVLFTFAPRTPALMLMKAAGKWFPRSDRSPAIEPIREQDLRSFFKNLPALAGTEVLNTEQVLTPFYKSQAMAISKLTDERQPPRG